MSQARSLSSGHSQPERAAQARSKAEAGWLILLLGLDGAGWLGAPQGLRAAAFRPGIARGREGWAVP